MAVVVQEMVSPECAGVMFSCDPLTSDPSCIFITANFGLGESVVSARADPDTYSLRRDGTDVSLVAKSVRNQKEVQSNSVGSDYRQLSAPHDPLFSSSEVERIAWSWN